MDTKLTSQPFRRYRAYLGTFNTNHIHLKNPWVAAWWSAAFPGMGHLLHGAYIKGFILFIWEFLINNMAHINLSILYTMTGQFELAKEVVDIRWFLMYSPVYIVSIWDSYRQTIEINQLYILAKREKAPIVPFSLGVMGFNYIDLRNPWVAVWWSLITPGLGHLYLKRIPMGFFLLIIWTVTCYYSNILPGIHFTMLGEFENATKVLDPQWLLFMPSIFGFSTFTAYALSVEYNKLFKTEQSELLQKNYQNQEFQIPMQGGGK